MRSFVSSIWNMPIVGDDKTWISISIGAAIMDAEHIYKNVDRLLKTADQRLYQAKILRDSAYIK